MSNCFSQFRRVYMCDVCRTIQIPFELRISALHLYSHEFTYKIKCIWKLICVSIGIHGIVTNIRPVIFMSKTLKYVQCSLRYPISKSSNDFVKFLHLVLRRMCTVHTTIFVHFLILTEKSKLSAAFFFWNKSFVVSFSDTCVLNIDVDQCDARP